MVNILLSFNVTSTSPLLNPATPTLISTFNNFSFFHRNNLIFQVGVIFHINRSFRLEYNIEEFDIGNVELKDGILKVSLLHNKKEDNLKKIDIL